MNHLALTEVSDALQRADHRVHVMQPPTHGALLLPLLRWLTGTAAALAAWLERRN